MPQIPIHVAEIKKLILKDHVASESRLSEDQLLNVLVSNSCGRNPTFFKAFGHNEVFGLKSSIPEGGTTVEILEKVPVEGGPQEDLVYRQEGVLYVHLPDGHPVITGSTPSEDEEVQASINSNLAEELSLDPLNMEAEVIIGEQASPIEVISLEDNTTEPVLIDVDVEEIKKRGMNLRPKPEPQPEIITLDDDVAATASEKSRRHNLRPQRTNKHLHALKQQAKRRKKNTSVAAGVALPQKTTSRRSTLTTGEIEIPFQPYQEELDKNPQTMKEVLTSIPGFQHRKLKMNKNIKKLSCSQMIQQTKEGNVNIESPESILGQVNLRTLLNKGTFCRLPPLYQFKLMQLLPQTELIYDDAKGLRLNSSAFNNEFFAKASHEWRERLLRGDFTPEAIQKCRSELESDKRKFDPWKLKHFEPIWGMKKNFDLNNLVPKVKDVDQEEKEMDNDNSANTVTKQSISNCDSKESDQDETVTDSVKEQQQQTAAEDQPNDEPLVPEEDDDIQTLMVSPTKSPRVTVTDTTEEIMDLVEPTAKKRKLEFPSGETPPEKTFSDPILDLDSKVDIVPEETLKTEKIAEAKSKVEEMTAETESKPEIKVEDTLEVLNRMDDSNEISVHKEESTELRAEELETDAEISQEHVTTVEIKTDASDENPEIKVCENLDDKVDENLEENENDSLDIANDKTSSQELVETPESKEDKPISVNNEEKSSEVGSEETNEDVEMTEVIEKIGQESVSNNKNDEEEEEEEEAEETEEGEPDEEKTEDEDYQPQQISSRQSSSEDSITAPLLISEEPLCSLPFHDSDTAHSAPPTLSPNGSSQFPDTSSVSGNDEDEAMLTSQEDLRRFSLDSDSSHNLRQSVDSIDSEMEITNTVSYADTPPILFDSSENVGDIELTMDVDGSEDNLVDGEGEHEGDVEEESQNSEESEGPVDDDSESMDSAQDVAVDDASSESQEAGVIYCVF